MSSSSTGRTLTTAQYTAQLIRELRLKNISGPQIGEIVTEIEAYVAETGESAQDAFGDPTEYGRDRAGDQRPARWGVMKALPTILAAAAGGFGLASGFSAGLSGSDVWGVGGWWVALVGAAVFFGVFCVVPIDAIVDPRRGRARFGRRSLLILTTVTAAVPLGLIAVLHLLTR